jgi:hypothetical protein
MTEVSYVVGGTAEDTFAVTFPFWIKDDLTVTIDDVPTVAFTLTGYGEPTGGVLTLDALIANQTIKILRTITCDRISSFPTYGEFRIEALNAELDRIYAKACDQGT